jgi:hypothetical protein
MRRFLTHIAYWALAGALVPGLILAFWWLTGRRSVGLQAFLFAPGLHLLMIPSAHLPTMVQVLLVVISIGLNAILYSIIGAIWWLLLALLRRLGGT